ncbi:hypothetical protein CH64_493 [Yersinia rohdei]|uniref:Inner membrane protein n=1 Tax=Yersinia rohdei TaxID=29485 RepID=A0ABM5S8P4_YERRO|nr:hypothetical protein [Yersinia rohdei]AJJ09627.1 hypothetical protein CH64_493 [Yersinia rohdei]EEQ02107.1 hypothetical protein yrohd0001_32240 [Yersinia rohdei ATCC 43380]
MDDKSIELRLAEKKFISKRDIEAIRKHAIGNNISFEMAIAQLKRVSLGTVILHFLLIIIGVFIFFSDDSSDFESYVFAAGLSIVLMNIVAPVILGAKLFFVPLQD